MNKMFKLANGSLVSLDTIQGTTPITMRDCFAGGSDFNIRMRDRALRIYTGDELRAMGIKYGFRMGRFVGCASREEVEKAVKKNKMRVASRARMGYTDYTLPAGGEEELLKCEYYYDKKAKTVASLEFKNYDIKDEDLDNVIMYEITTSVRLNLGLNGTDNVTFCVRPEEYERLVKNFEIV